MELIVVCAAILVCLLNGQSMGAPVLMASCFGLYHLKALDRSILNSSFLYFVSDIIVAAVVGALLSVALFRLFPVLSLTADAWLLSAAVAGMLPIGLRGILGRIATRSGLTERILIVGDSDFARKLYRAIAAEQDSHDGKSSAVSALVEDRAVPVDAEKVRNVLLRDNVSRLIVAERDESRRRLLFGTLLDLRMRGLRVVDAIDYYEQLAGKIWIDAADSEWFIYSDGFDARNGSGWLKRGMDVALALMLLAFTAPLLAAIAVAIKLTSRGPVFFRQTRVGLYGEHFEVYKFRSMRLDAEFETGPTWAREKDDRVTPIGRMLRNFRLDEIPQALNVLRGQMSFVGPRPERPFFADRLAKEIPFYHLRHYVKPGITGWAQVMYPYGASVDDAWQKLQYDLYYAKHCSIWRDLEILLKTVKVVLFSKGR